jgi:protein TonB
LKELRARGELVIGPCAGESCQDLSGTSGTIKNGAVQKGKITKLVQPDYPAIARAARAAGVVTVQVVVSEEGNVLAAQAIDGHPLLQASAVKAARQVVFAPTLLDGKPVKTVGVIPFNFALSR